MSVEIGVSTTPNFLMPPKKKAKAKAKAADPVVVDPFKKDLEGKTVEELQLIEQEWINNLSKEKRSRMLAMYDRV